MKVLSNKQRNFLEHANGLHYNQYSSFTHNFPKTVEGVLKRNEYKDDESIYLNIIAKEYKTWLNDL